MPINSRAKGCRAERELAQELREIMGWTNARRTQQFSGWNPEASDVVVPEVPSLFVEVKHVQRLNVPEAMKKASEQSGEKLPMVFHRRNRQGWLVTVNLSDLREIVKTLYDSTSREQSEKQSTKGGI